jgi:hypothetical protein
MGGCQCTCEGRPLVYIGKVVGDIDGHMRPSECLFVLRNENCHENDGNNCLASNETMQVIVSGAPAPTATPTPVPSIS